MFKQRFLHVIGFSNQVPGAYIALTVFILSLYFFSDLNSRFTSSTSESDQAEIKQRSQLSERMLMNPAEQKEITAFIQSFVDDAVEKTTSIKGLSLEKQKQQQGDLEQLYSRDFRYRLKGIFTSGKAVAIIQQTQLSNNNNTLVEIGLGGQLNDYTITRIQPNYVEALGNGNTVKLFLYRAASK